MRRIGRFVFGCDDTLSLEVLRIGVGLVLLVAFVPMSAELGALFGPHGWISPASAREIGGGWSALDWLGTPWQLALFHVLFLVSCAALCVGFETRWVKWLVWAGFLSYVHRNPALVYGVDRFLACFLPLVCLAPVGRRWSIDALRKRRPGAPNEWESRRASAAIRLLQLQMAVVFLFAAAHKLQGEMWWSGHALWIALHNFEFARWPAGWLAERYWLANLATHGAVLVELAYPFLIWGRRSRPLVLAAAALLHVGIAALMGLQLFAFVALCGHAAFVPDRWWLGLAVRVRAASSATARWSAGVVAIDRSTPSLPSRGRS